jgi:hypothetical protein
MIYTIAVADAFYYKSMGGPFGWHNTLSITDATKFANLADAEAALDGLVGAVPSLFCRIESYRTS